MVPCVYVAVTLGTGSLVVYQFITESRSPTLPPGAVATGDGGRWRREPTDANIAIELKKAFPTFDAFGRGNPQPDRWVVVPLEALPSDRTYRNAWRCDGAHVYHDLPHARQIHLEHIRQARLEELGKLDRDWTRAMGQGDTVEVERVEGERQRLRDLPATLEVDKATTVDELKALWPEGLRRV